MGQSIIGVGPLGPLSGLGGLEFDATGKPTGSVEVMKLFGQLMVYAYASDLPFANVTEATASRFLAWQHWYRSVVDYTSEKVVANTHLLRQMLSSLLNQAKADIFVGHDGNLDAIAALLDLTWEAPPFLGGNLLPTPPNSGLLFELDLQKNRTPSVRQCVPWPTNSATDAHPSPRHAQRKRKNELARK